MAFEYTYPEPPVGYMFTLLTRVESEVGVAPVRTSITDGQITIGFTLELTTQQETDLGTLMADDPRNPPTPIGTVILIDDIWENKARDEAATGMNWDVYFTESTPGSGLRDRIELHFSSVLTNPQKNTVINYVKDLVRES